MADETIFEFLHAEIVNYIINRNESKDKDSKVDLVRCGNQVILKIPVLGRGPLRS